MDCSIVDVFAEHALSGNQLAVVRDCDALDTGTMQAIAREMNFSETTFVVTESAREARIRIFTPGQELPFAGHPTLGTAWVLGRHHPDYTLSLKAGRVRVTFEPTGIVWMQPPPVHHGAELPAASSAALVNLTEHDLASRYQAQFLTVGPRFVLIGVNSLDALKRARPDAAAHAGLSGAAPLGIFLFSAEAYQPDADFAARMFFDANGWREDPATGSANAAFAAYLRALGTAGRFIVEQGFEINRPSRLYLEVGPTIRVGGKVRHVLAGTLHV